MEQEDHKTEKSSQRICKLFLKRKHRFCKFECLPDSDYCHHHAHESARKLEEFGLKESDVLKSDYAEESGRIPCPLDPSHCVDPNKLDKHLKKCTALK